MESVHLKALVPLPFNEATAERVYGVIRSVVERNWREHADQWSIPAPRFKLEEGIIGPSYVVRGDFSAVSDYGAVFYLLPEKDGQTGLAIYFPRAVLVEELADRENRRILDRTIANAGEVDLEDEEEEYARWELLSSLGSAVPQNRAAIRKLVVALQAELGIEHWKASEELQSEV